VTFFAGQPIPSAFVPNPSSKSSSQGGYTADLALLAVGGSALLIALILWLDSALGRPQGRQFPGARLHPVADASIRPR